MSDLKPADIAQITARGTTVSAVEAQLARLRNPPPPIRLDRPCTMGDGIVRLEPDGWPVLLERGDTAVVQGRVTKFVPASGAATRMFKDVIAALQGNKRPSESAAGREFFTRLDQFAFAEELRARAGVAGSPANEAEERRLLEAMLSGMRYAEQPKALIAFHRGNGVRTAFEEQLLEGIPYTRGQDGTCRMHFTVSPEHRPEIEALLQRLSPAIEARRRGTRLAISFSEQHPATDTVAIDDHGRPFRNADGSLLFRQAGHGSLLHNLQQLGGDLVVIKNIDNVVPEEVNTEVVLWKRLLIGYLAELEGSAREHLTALHQSGAGAGVVDAAAAFVERVFARRVAGDDVEARRRAVIAALDRPLRIAGVVRNEGEPGGAPFWTVGPDGRRTVQIVESSQVDAHDSQQMDLFRTSTHFNPVDIICALKRWDGSEFTLEDYVDPDTAFVVRKSAGGKDLTALERPGLWNGAMAGWNTVCVEVPANTFAPVKTVFDLLRPQHQPPATAVE